MKIKFTVEVDGRRVFAVGGNGEAEKQDTVGDALGRLRRAYEAAKKA